MRPICKKVFKFDFSRRKIDSRLKTVTEIMMETSTLNVTTPEEITTTTTSSSTSIRKPQIAKETPSENETVDKTKTRKVNENRRTSNRDDLADSLSQTVVKDEGNGTVSNKTYRNEINETVLVPTTATTTATATATTIETISGVRAIEESGNATRSRSVERAFESDDLMRATNRTSFVVNATSTEDTFEVFATTLEPEARTPVAGTETEDVATESMPETETSSDTVTVSTRRPSSTPAPSSTISTTMSSSTSPSTSTSPSSSLSPYPPPATSPSPSPSSSPSSSPSPKPSSTTSFVSTSPKVSSTTTHISSFELPVNESSSKRNDYYEVYNSSSTVTNRTPLVTATTPSSFQPSHADDSTELIIQVAVASTIFCCLLIFGVIMFIRKRRFSSLQFAQNAEPVNSPFGRSSIRKMNSRFSIRSLVRQSFSNKSPPSRKLTADELLQSISHPVQIDTEFGRLPKTNVSYSEVPAGCEDKNRYANVIPRPETRVRLMVGTSGDKCAQYINANYVECLARPVRKYIACQAPMENTIEDFWKMVWENRTEAIIMLTDFVEDNKEKCAVYLPLSEVIDSTKTFTTLQVVLKKRDFFDKYSVSYLELKNFETNSTHELVHFAYVDWPEKRLPPEPRTIITILQRVNAYLKRQTSQPEPVSGEQTPGPPCAVVVHCSNGTGRTGTVIAIDTAIHQFHQTQTVDIPAIVTNIRKGRARAVETRDQYSFIYKTVNFYVNTLAKELMDE